MTKFVLTGDIHYGNLAASGGTGPFTIDEHKKFAAQMHAEKPDVLIVAGDCAETCLTESFLPEFLDTYKNHHGVSLCVPGNHDMWLESAGSAYTNGELAGAGRKVDWAEKYDWFFKTASRKGWIGLRDKPWDDGKGLYVVGNMGWYDFSTIDPSVGKTSDFYERERNWSDYWWMRLKGGGSPTPMLDINRKTMAELSQSFSKVPEDRKGLVVVTHIVGFSRLMSDFGPMDYGRAFFGNLSIGEMAIKAGADVYYCGHSHGHKEFHLGNTRCMNNGSDYGKGSKRYDVIDI